MTARRARSGFAHGVRASLRNNLSAYGFSVMITATFGVLGASLGSPDVGQVFLFAGGAVTGVTLVDGITSHEFREKMRGEPSDVVALGAALGYVSIGVAIGLAALIAKILQGGIAWGLGALGASVIFVLISGIEMTLARIAQEDREAEESEDGPA